jgi:hypothetical protein
MTLEKRLPSLSTEEILDCEMQEEIDEQIKWLKRYEKNLCSLLNKDRANQVRKAMINFLVEQL